MGNYEGSQKDVDQNHITFYQHSNPGYLRITGSDRHSFLQRQTTNNIDLLSPDRSLVTVLTSPAGRILDVLWVIDEDESLGVMTLPGQREQTLNFLQSRIFFMDKVILEDASQGLSQVDLLGSRVREFLEDLSNVQKPADNEILTLNITGFPVKVLVQRDFAHRLLVPQEASRQVLAELEASGAESLSPDSFEILRVESGLPASGNELTEDYTPLETGFRWAVSDNKGCYTGQEVIARQVNYDKITRQLVGLRMSETPQIGDTLYPLDKQQPVGKVTSSALSPRFGPIALAIIKRPFHQPGNELLTGDGEQSITAKTTALPFQ
jgi:folate-binding protein YgfZ